MGRKRRRINEALPPGVYRKRNGFIYRKYLGVVDGKPRFAKDVYLCSTTATTAQLWTAFEVATGEQVNTLRWMLKQYHASQQFRELARRTQDDYAGYRDKLTGKPLKDGTLFGDVPLSDIDMFTIRQYLDLYRDAKGNLAPIAANRHIQYLKAAWNWAKARHRDVPPNPCIGVKLNRETPRSRLIAPDEYAVALSLATGYLPIMMELAYLCRARVGEIRELRRSDVLKDGLRLVRAKGSEGEITLWTQRLSAAVDRAKDWNLDAPTPIGGAYLIHDKAGQPIKKNAFDSAWRRLMDKVESAGIERFTFHDLKAMGYSEMKGEQFAGHRSGKMHKTYNRKLRQIKPPE